MRRDRAGWCRASWTGEGLGFESEKQEPLGGEGQPRLGMMGQWHFMEVPAVLASSQLPPHPPSQGLQRGF